MKTYSLAIVFLSIATILSAHGSTAESTQTIVVLGDSLSANYGNPSTKPGWVDLLAQRLEQCSTLYQVINMSTSGDTTTQGILKSKRIIEQDPKPNVVIVELGGNDGLQGRPISLIEKNLTQIVQTFKQQNIKVILAGVRIPPNYGPLYTQAFSALFDRVRSLDVFGFVPRILANIAGHPSLMQDDGIHPKSEAQKMILENIWPALEPLCQPK